MCAELACNDKERQAPFERISANPSEFIDAKHLPMGITLKDPHNMKLEFIIAFFKHVNEIGSHWARANNNLMQGGVYATNNRDEANR